MAHPVFGTPVHAPQVQQAPAIERPERPAREFDIDPSARLPRALFAEFDAVAPAVAVPAAQLLNAQVAPAAAPQVQSVAARVLR